MTEHISRYTLSIIANGEEIPFAKSNLANLYTITTHFNDDYDLSHFIAVENNIKINAEDIRIRITYQYDEKTNDAPVLYYRDASYHNKELLKRKLVLYSEDKTFLASFIEKFKVFIYDEYITKLKKAEREKNYGDGYVKAIKLMMDKMVDITAFSTINIAKVYDFIKQHEQTISDSLDPIIVKEEITEKELNTIRELLKEIQVLKIKEEQQTFFNANPTITLASNASVSNREDHYKNVVGNKLTKQLALQEKKEEIRYLVNTGQYERLAQDYPEVQGDEIHEILAEEHKKGK